MKDIRVTLRYESKKLKKRKNNIQINVEMERIGK